jgi:hypothetical protein
MSKNSKEYIDVYIDVINANGKRVTHTLKFKSLGITQFFNNQHNIVELTAGAISFYFYAAERMNWKNEIVLDIDFKNEYVAFISKVTSRKEFLSVPALDKYIRKLKELGLLILLGTPHSGYYLVSPKYVYKGSEFARKKQLKEIIEYRISKGLPLKGLIDTIDEALLT